LHKQCGFRTRKEAQEAEAAARQQLMRLTTGITFLQAANHRLDLLQAYATPRHYRDNLAMLRRFPEWKDLLLQEITPQMVRDKLMALAQQLSPHNANRHLRSLRAVFELAVNDGHLDRNPCRGLKPFPLARPVIFVPSPEQLAVILLLARPLDQAYLELLLDTGARIRELNYLPWADVDWAPTAERPQGRVRLWTRKKRHGDLTPRWVSLSARGRKALQYAWDHRDPNSPYVFTNPHTGRAYDYRAKFLKRLCRRAGVPEFGFHALRHAYASTLADKLTPLHTIRDLLGHENISTTSHYLKSLGRGG
jgi:integrase